MTKLQQLRPLLLRTCQRCCQSQRFTSSSGNKSEESPDDENHESIKKASRPMYIPEIPPTLDDISEPTTCCMSGCANCVWIEYAEKLSSVLKSSQVDVQKTIMDKIQDPNMRAYLTMELRVRKLID